MAKCRNDSNLLVREIGQGRDVQERSLEIAQLVEGGDGAKGLLEAVSFKKATESVGRGRVMDVRLK